MLSFSTQQLVKAWLLPPGLNVALFLVSVLVVLKYKWLGRSLMLSSILTLYLLSTPFVANRLVLPLEGLYPPLSLEKEPLLQGAEAIVILSGGRQPVSGQSGAYEVNTETLARIRFGVRLAQKTGLPILVSGGVVQAEDKESEAVLMMRALENFGIEPKWLESQSVNTYENAKYSADILKFNRIKRIYCVTSAWHIPRSIWAFHQFNIEAIAAPTSYRARLNRKQAQWLPDIGSFRDSYWALHEYIGLIAYKYRFRTSSK